MLFRSIGIMKALGASEEGVAGIFVLYGAFVGTVGGLLGMLIGVTFMHYECELAVVIGAPARNVSVDQALQHVAGYCVCNDYAVRDYLENWYRPNLRVKNRDGATVLGPAAGDQACGEVGDGRMLEPAELRDELIAFFQPKLLAGRKLLITAGPT